MNEEMLHGYLDGELTAAEVTLVEHVLASDAHWASEYEVLCAVDASVGELPGLTFADDGRAWARGCVSRSGGAVGAGGAAGAGGRLFRLLGPLVAAAAAIAIIVLPANVPANVPETVEIGVSPMVFSVEDQVQYLYWETDSDTFGSGDLQSLESEIVAALETS